MRGADAAGLVLALPSKGRLGEAAAGFLAAAGLPVFKPNSRQYTGTMPNLPGAQVVFQRPLDILNKVMQTRADIGITGLDIVREYSEDSADIIIIDRLGFGKCELLLAVPEAWFDVTSIADLADLSLRQQWRGERLRVACKFNNLTKNFLYAQGISHFSLVHAEGALEAAPRMGYADLIADLSETGTTLRENHLRPLEGGCILASEAVLIGNRRALRDAPIKLEMLREMLELIEAHRRARNFVSLRANIAGASVADVQKRILAIPELGGSKGPGVVAVASPPAAKVKWFEANLLTPAHKIHKTMQLLRTLGGTDIIVTRPHYVFEHESATFRALEKLLEKTQAEGHS